MSISHIRERPSTPDTLFFALLILICAVFFIKPFAFDFLHFREAGDNLNMGFSLAEEGTFFPVDEFFRDMPDEYRGYFYDSFYGSSEDPYDLFPGYRFKLDDSGSIKFRHFYAFPAMISVFAELFGVRGAPYISSLIMLLSVFLLYILTRLLVGKLAARIAAILFSFSFLATYFSWFHGAESPFLMFVLLMLISLLCLLRSGKSNLAFTIIFVFAFQALYMVRTEFFFIFAGLLLFLLVLPRSLYYRIKPALILSFLSMIPVTIFYLIFLPRYLYGILSEGGSGSVLNTISMHKYSILLLILALVVFFWKRRPLRRIAWRWINIAILVVFVGFIVFSVARAGIDKPFQRFHNISTLADYSGTAFVLVAFFGFALLLAREKGVAYKAVACITFPIFIYFLNEMHNYPLQPWCMRRYITLTYPILFVFAAYAVNWSWEILAFRLRHGKAFSSFITLIVVLILAVGIIVPLPHLFRYIKEGITVNTMIDELGRFSNRFSQEDVLIFHMDYWEYSAAFPLKMVFGMNTILMPRDRTDPGPQSRVGIDDFEKILKYEDGVEKYCEAVSFWRNEGRSVYMIKPSNRFLSSIESNSSVSIEKSPHLNYRFTFLIYPILYDQIPDSLSKVRWNYSVYEILTN